MTATFIILAIVVIAALAFDFTNGFHDTANAMAPSIATGALQPVAAVSIAAFFNLIGAFLSVNVAATVAKGVVNLDSYNLGAAADGVPVDGVNLLIVVFTGLIGGILWNLLTWLLGMPSSSSHALFGGLIGAAFAAMGASGVAWSSIAGKILIPAFVAPILAAIVAAIATRVSYAMTQKIKRDKRDQKFRYGQIVTACLLALAHGAGDAQKTMGVIFLALVAAGETTTDARIPTWVIVSCAVAIALGTLSGGWRVIKTLGRGVVEIEAPQGMSADATSAAIVLTSAAGGMALSTTHVATGSITGSGIGRKGAEVHWNVVRRMVAAWFITIPMAALVGFVTWWICTLIANATEPVYGVLVDFAILVGLSLLIFIRSRKNPVHAGNVKGDNHDTTDGGAKAKPEVKYAVHTEPVGREDADATQPLPLEGR